MCQRWTIIYEMNNETKNKQNILLKNETKNKIQNILFVLVRICQRVSESWIYMSIEHYFRKISQMRNTRFTPVLFHTRPLYNMYVQHCDNEDTLVPIIDVPSSELNLLAFLIWNMDTWSLIDHRHSIYRRFQPLQGVNLEKSGVPRLFKLFTIFPQPSPVPSWHQLCKFCLTICQH